MSLLYKYREFGENTDRIILNSKLYFASHNSFNDPFDCNLEFREITSYLDEEFENYCQEELEKGVDKEKYLTDLSEKLIKAKSEVGILCLSRNKKNILMWSHYAKNHEGLCFGFEDKLYNGNITYSKVSYPKRKKYELISFFNPQKGEIKRIFTTKSKFWKYEKEIRLLDLTGGKTTGAKEFKKEYLKEILFGCKSDETNIRKVIQLCQLNEFKHVIFKKARIVLGKFELDFDEIDKNKYL